MSAVRLPHKLAAPLHNFRIGGIENTPILEAEATGLMYVSQICHRDVRCWLVAIKSVSAAIGAGEFTVLDDGSLTEEDRELLRRHVGGLRILPIAGVPRNGCPAGGTWERLLALLELASSYYVVQVDADLVAQCPLGEATSAIRANRGFILSGERGVTVTTVRQAAENARQITFDHVQFAAERLLDHMPKAEELRYVRGCSGFAGFPRGENRATAVAFSAFMQQHLGERWNVWGSEQVTSNFLVANSGPDPLVLPWVRFPAFGWQGDISQAALIHFVGTYRYEGGVYTRFSKAAIRRLSTKP
ncbi:MAG: hypothetical protein ABSC06_20220 [Rhodopila sp.]|jgi:hypothetical protein